MESYYCECTFWGLRFVPLKSVKPSSDTALFDNQITSVQCSFSSLSSLLAVFYVFFLVDLISIYVHLSQSISQAPFDKNHLTKTYRCKSKPQHIPNGGNFDQHVCPGCFFKASYNGLIDVRCEIFFISTKLITILDANAKIFVV